MPVFICTEKEGRPTLERGASTLITIPEFPTFPFQLDLPICIAVAVAVIEYKKMSMTHNSTTKQKFKVQTMCNFIMSDLPKLRQMQKDVSCMCSHR